MTHRLWLPSYFCSGMILQQQVSSMLRGCTRPLTQVTLQMVRKPFDGRKVSPLDSQYGLVCDLTADSDGQGAFAFDLPAFEASFDPFTLTVGDGQACLQFDNVLFGEIWIAAGQSNMAMPLRAVQGAEQTANLANLYYVRVLSQPASGLGGQTAAYGFEPISDLSAAVWQRGDQPEAMATVSAIGYLFAREVQLELKVPVGLIETAAKDSYIHSWISRLSIDQQPVLQKHIQELGFYRTENDWNLAVGDEWARHQPAALFNNKVAPLQGLGVRGMLWYPGEGDYQYPGYYQLALQTLVRDWQHVFRPADPRGLGFLCVQPAPLFYGQHRFSQLAEFNEMLSAVRRSLPDTSALVPIYDLTPVFADAPADWRSPGNPTIKQPISQRLKTVAMGLLYQRKAPASAPECTDIEVVGSKLMISFDNIGEGLRLIGDGERLRGFAICGPDRVFTEARAKLLYGLRVLVWHDQIEEPCAVTYAFADLNSYANLISRDQLPVVPFRSDRAKSRYCPPQEWTHCEQLQVWCCPEFSRPDETGWHPAWRIERGKGELLLEKANKNEGDGSLLLRYNQPDCREFGLEPLLHYESMFPPLDWTIYSQISVDVFNADQQIKHLQLAVAAGPADAPLRFQTVKVTILPVLRWQRLQFDLNGLGVEDRASIRRVVFLIEDHKGRGSLYLDQIRLIRPKST